MTKLYRAYAGIGSRTTPVEILDQITNIAAKLSEEGWTLRSGGAVGADNAFQLGAAYMGGSKEIMLPWDGFNGQWQDNKSIYCPINQMSLELAEKFHPAWHHCTPAAKKLHARNCHQILGFDLRSPVEMVICWTENAARQGGTGQALRIAEHYKIPIFDLADPTALDRLNEFAPQPA